MKKINIGLFGKVVIAILTGVACGYVMPECGVRLFKTFNVLFAQVLKFIVPMLILGLVTPAISDVGKGAGKMLLVVMALSYISTAAAGFFAYGCSMELMPHYIEKGSITSAADGIKFLPYFELKIPPLCDVLTALAIAFMVGIGVSFTRSEALKRVTDEFGEVVKFTIMRVIIPGLPIYILTMICELTASGKLVAMAGTLFKVIGTGWVLTLAFLVILYTVACIIAGRNPLVTLWRMLPAYLTGLSICSSSAVIPVTLECTRKNGIDKDVRNFVIPLCANVHMVGSATKLLSGAVAISLIYDQPLQLAQVVNFTFMMAIAAVAAPGVMCGVLMASVGLVESIFGFNAEQIALLITFYSALDGYGPAANVTGDGAIAVIVNRFFGKKDAQCLES
jgi:Na+/H+-dicarboxylate symporter